MQDIDPKVRMERLLATPMLLQANAAARGDVNGTWALWPPCSTIRARVLMPTSAADRCMQRTCSAAATLAGRFLDPDDRVRAMAAKVVQDMPAAALVHLSGNVLSELLGRCLDKKVSAAFAGPHVDNCCCHTRGALIRYVRVVQRWSLAPTATLAQANVRAAAIPAAAEAYLKVKQFRYRSCLLTLARPRRH